jgi:polyhydroxybutyrate depolymerase
MFATVFRKVVIVGLIVLVIMMGACSSPEAEVVSTAVPPTVTPPPTATPVPMVPAGDFEHTVMVGDLERSYLLHIPPNLEVSTSVPAVFMFHGSERSAIEFLPFGFKELADEKGFIIVRPNGTTHHSEYPYALSWNAGTCCHDPVIDNIDEAAFIRAILSDLESIVTVNPKRIYAHGFSNGGMLVYRLACEMSETFAAIAPYAGTLVYTPCQPQQPVSILNIHGGADWWIPFESVTNRSSPDVPEPAIAGIKTWAQFNGCTEASQIETGDDNIIHAAYADCGADSVIEYIVIQNQSHDYPSVTVLPMAEVIWNFFEAHPKP